MPRLTLETFSDQPEPDTGSAEATFADEARLAGFDAGYAAGWDDAANAYAQDRSLAEAKTAEALQSLGFTYQEARNHVLNALHPLLTDIAAKLLPQIAHAALPALIAETIAPLAANLSEPPVTFRLHPDTRPMVEALCVPALGLPVTIVEDSGLTAGDIRLTLDTIEARVDLDGAIAAITAAIADYFGTTTKVYTDVG